MSVFLDVQFLNEISYRFEQFSRKGDFLFNCRCPICGDSSRDKTKARGYFYKGKYGMSFKCHNCGAAISFAAMLKDMEPLAYQRYKLEKYKMTKPIQVSRLAPASASTVVKNIATEYPFLTRLSDMPTTSDARQYFARRKIPTQFLTQLYFVEKTRFLNALSDKYKDKYRSEEPRLVLPFFNAKKELVGVTARDLTGLSPKKYLALKIREDQDFIFGLDRFDATKPGFVVEGPIDSLFLPNAIAVGSASLYRAESHVDKDQVTMVFDNQPRNKELLKEMAKTMNAEFRMCFWPETMQEKDVNEMVLAGNSIDEVVQIIDMNSYQGLAARLAFNRWRRTE